jgi:ribosome-binding protein aMBF1 (putative translation factor)
MNIANFQDWEPVVLKPNKGSVKTTIKQQNPQGFKEYIKLVEEDIPKLPKMSREYAQAIVAGRNALGLNQKQLAQKLAVKDNIIKDYENCSVVNFNLGFYKRILKAVNVDPKTVL